MKNIYILSSIVLLLSSCGGNNKVDADYFGKIERDQISIVTKVPGKIEKFLVNQGDFVRKGDTLAILEIPEVEAKKAQAKGALESASAQYDMAKKGATEGQLTQLNAKVSGLKEQYDFAKKSLERLSNLLQDSLVSQQQYDEVYAKYQGARNQYLAAQAEIEEVKNGARQEQQLIALGQQERALGVVSEVEIAEKERFMIAPQDMTVETINLKVGELALPGYPVVNGYLPLTTYFRFTISEEKIGEFEKDQKLSVQIPYKDNKIIPAQIVLIKALSSYANIATAYPDFDHQKALFEIKLVPVNVADAENLITQATVVLKP